jgi:hypothetical protein
VHIPQSADGEVSARECLSALVAAFSSLNRLSLYRQIEQSAPSTPATLAVLPNNQHASQITSFRVCMRREQRQNVGLCECSWLIRCASRIISFVMLVFHRYRYTANEEFIHTSRNKLRICILRYPLFRLDTICVLEVGSCCLMHEIRKLDLVHHAVPFESDEDRIMSCQKNRRPC